MNSTGYRAVDSLEPRKWSSIPVRNLVNPSANYSFSRRSSIYLSNRVPPRRLLIGVRLALNSSRWGLSHGLFSAKQLNFSVYYSFSLSHDLSLLRPSTLSLTISYSICDVDSSLHASNLIDVRQPHEQPAGVEISRLVLSVSLLSLLSLFSPFAL